MFQDLVSDIDKTEEIEEEVVSEEILEASEASDEKSGIEIDLHSNRDIWEVSVQSRGPEKSEYDYSEDFVTEGPNTTQRDKSHLSLRSEQSEIAEDVFSQTRLDTARSTAEISEAISERLPTASASESFVNKLDLNVGRQGKEHNGANEEESDAENERSSIIGSSRPSSGRSERSQFSSVTYTTEHETSESEKSPGLPNEKDFEEEDVSLQEVNTKTAKAYTGTSFDIDDLLGTPEELTPMPSPRDESSRGHSQSSRMSHFFDPLGDFEIGDQVSLTAPSGERTVGTLLFKGNVQFAPGVWAGVELEEPEGRHDGIEDGVRYFTCKARHGLIVPGHDIQQVIHFLLSFLCIILFSQKNIAYIHKYKHVIYRVFLVLIFYEYINKVLHIYLCIIYRFYYLKNYTKIFTNFHMHTIKFSCKYVSLICNLYETILVVCV
ncbi:hypothetical protein DPMN_148884 [Dreissena polymorpha]|uniref:CAP-Gly domain-containing protein n=1 Tax=Dreissena polymorpha TaxID=45954 RepID=A0A9D4J492_DREPO|nr:hypothetical protein DPMN_148884 [Dreissena polymorpha]